MKQALRLLLQKPTTYVGVATALLFQIIFSVVWMTGYNGVSDRIDKLHVGVVNEDTQFGAGLVSGLKAALPLQVEDVATMEEAREQLENRDIQMIVHVPADFSARVAGAEQAAAINYVINESNPLQIKSMMTSVAAQITANANKQAIAAGVQSFLQQLPADQAAAASAILSERVVAQTETVNAVQGMNNQMVPMMLVLASYVGAMIMGQNLEVSNMAVKSRTGRWGRLGARIVINLAASVIVSLVGASLLAALGGQFEHGFLALWAFQALFVLTFMFVSQMFLVLFGMAGMLFNILLLSVQLVSSGAMMPRELLPDFYVAIGTIFPATYAVEGLMNTLFGGPGLGSASLSLLLILAAAVLIMLAGTALRKDGKAAAVAQESAVRA